LDALGFYSWVYTAELWIAYFVGCIGNESSDEYMNAAESIHTKRQACRYKLVVRTSTVYIAD
jgi:hypothetical protein